MGERVGFVRVTAWNVLLGRHQRISGRGRGKRYGVGRSCERGAECRGEVRGSGFPEVKS